MDAVVAGFLDKHQITTQDWEKSQCEWNTLVKIRDDYVAKIEDFSRVAEFQAGTMSVFSISNRFRTFSGSKTIGIQGSWS